MLPECEKGDVMDEERSGEVQGTRRLVIALLIRTLCSDQGAPILSRMASFHFAGQHLLHFILVKDNCVHVSGSFRF